MSRKVCIFAIANGEKSVCRKKAHFRLILLLVNLDTSRKIMQGLMKMIASLMCIRIPYDTASGVNQFPYLHN